MLGSFFIIGWYTSVLYELSMVLKSGSKLPSWHPEFAQVGTKILLCKAEKDEGLLKYTESSVTTGNKSGWSYGFMISSFLHEIKANNMIKMKTLLIRLDQKKIDYLLEDQSLLYRL